MNIYKQHAWISIAASLLLLSSLAVEANSPPNEAPSTITQMSSELEDANFISIIDRRRLKIDRNQISSGQRANTADYHYVQFQPASVGMIKRWRSIHPRSMHRLTRRLSKKDQLEVEGSLSEVVDKQLELQLSRLTSFELIDKETNRHETQPYLIIKPEVTRLNVNALPKHRHNGRIRTLSREYSGTLILYVFDGRSGQLLGKIEDRERTTNINWTPDLASNGHRETKRLVKKWLAALDDNLKTLLKDRSS